MLFLKFISFHIIVNLLIIEISALCDIDQFKCHSSGLCIDISLVCDFGFDCGHEDRSDEQYCDNYPGRCDFEEQTKCAWLAYPSRESWLWVGALKKDTTDEYDGLLRPPVDHTIQSADIGGHFMLVNLKQAQKEFRMIGPTVRLQQGSKECRIRFWLYGQQLDGKQPTLHVSDQNIDADSLFKTRNWKRYDLDLLDSSHYETRYLDVRISVIFETDFSGFIALDDVSFTPGCSLTFLSEPTEDVCGQNQFYCAIPTRVTSAYCLPIEYYCDFKDDCGIKSGIASDEFDCPRACLFNNAGSECKFKILDGAYLNAAGESSTEQVNEAFGWHTRGAGLTIESKFHSFSQQLSKDPLKQSLDLRNLRMELPKFSECHGNCQFELIYQWSTDAKHLIASVWIKGARMASEILLKRIIPGEMKGLQTARFGLGQQSAPFIVTIEVSFEEELEQSSRMAQQPFGSFEIHSYQFIECNFIEGLVDTAHQIQFEEFVDDEGELEFPPPIDRNCDAGFFQCNSPVVCIPEHLICDMQRDCQGGADELDCGDQLSYDFDDDDDNLGGWFSADLLEAGLNASKLVKWHLVGGPQVNRNWRGVLDSGPPFDHSRADNQGGFLLLTGSDHRSWPAASVADMISPRFRASDSSSGCQLVLYIYFYGENLNRFQVIRRIVVNDDDDDDLGSAYSGKPIQDGGEQVLYEIRGSDEQLDAWRRVQAKVGPLIEGLEFVIILRAFKSSGWSDLIAIDDISLGWPCQLVSNTSGKQQQAALSNQLFDGNQPTTYWMSALIIGICIIAASGLLIVAIIRVSGGATSRSMICLTLLMNRATLITRDESGDLGRAKRANQSYSMEVLSTDNDDEDDNDDDRIFLIETSSSTAPTAPTATGTAALEPKHTEQFSLARAHQDKSV